MQTLQRRHAHCPPAVDGSTAANEYSISTRSGCRVVASCQHLNNRHTRFQCSLHSQRLESARSTPQREPEFDTGRVVTVIEDTPSLSTQSPMPNYYAANGHSISSRPSCSTHQPFTSCQHLNKWPYFDSDPARPPALTDILLKSGHIIKSINPYSGNIFFLA